MSARSFHGYIYLVILTIAAVSAERGTIIDVLNTLQASIFKELLAQVDFTTGLNGKGPFTVFAPSNEAFAFLSQAEFYRLTHNKTLLKQVMGYHIYLGIAEGRDFNNEKTVESINGYPIRFNIYEQEKKTVFTVSGSPIVYFDQLASNGVVHSIDKLMYPVAAHTADGDTYLCDAYTEYYYILQQSGLNLTQFSEGHPFTVFIPNNQSFDKLPPGAREYWDVNPPALKRTLRYHMVNGTWYSAGMYNGQRLKTLEGLDIKIVIDAKGNIGVNNTYSRTDPANVLYPDRSTKDGVIHVLDSVLLPRDN